MTQRANGRQGDGAPWWVIPLDVAMINLALVLAYVLRYRLQWFLEVTFDAPLHAYAPFTFLFSFLIPLILWMEKGYSQWRGRQWLDQVYRVINAVTTTLVLVLALAFIFRPLVYSRLLLLISGLMMMGFLSLDRAALALLEAHLRRRGIGVRRIVIVGAGEVGRRVMRTIVARPDLGYEVVGYVDDNPSKGEGEIGRFKGLGSIDNLSAIIDAEDIDEVIVTLPWNYHRRILNVMRECARKHVSARLVPDLFQMSMSRVEVSDLGGVPMVDIHEIAFDRVELFFKRALDLAIASLVVFCGWPVLALIALAIRLDSPGPILFKQLRVGQHGQHFEIYKFRSMRIGAEREKEELRALNEAQGALFKIRADPRVTRVGRWLRQTSLDELPQLLNVFRGEMSVVGPRPQVIEEVSQYQPWHRARLVVPPGMTGMWQVSGRSELTFDEMVLLDLYYIENWSPWLDFNILLRTIPKILLKEGAY